MRLKPDDGIWLAPSMGIHTIGMLFAIDLIYLDDANRVIHLVENLGPWRISPIRIRCAGILELKARSIFSSNTQVGDHVLVCTEDEIHKFCRSGEPLPIAVAAFEEHAQVGTAGRGGTGVPKPFVAASGGSRAFEEP